MHAHASFLYPTQIFGYSCMQSLHNIVRRDPTLSDKAVSHDKARMLVSSLRSRGVVQIHDNDFGTKQ